MFNDPRKVASVLYRCDGGTGQPKDESTFIYTVHDKVLGIQSDRRYVHLGSDKGTLAVYRIFSSGAMKRSHRRPNPQHMPDHLANIYFVQRAMKAYHRCRGPRMPSLAFSNVWGKEMHEYDHRPAYIVLNDAHYRLAVYRIRPCGRLRLLRHCPKKIGMLEGALEIFRELEQLDRIEAAEAFTFKQLARA